MKGEKSFMFTKDDKIKAVYSDDLELFLQKAGCAEEFRNGQIHCRYCNTVITAKNLYAMVPVNTTLEFCCTGSACIISLAEEAKA